MPMCVFLQPLFVCFCRFVGAVSADAAAARAPPSDTADSIRGLISVIKKEEITINVDLGEKIPVLRMTVLALFLAYVSICFCRQ